jgi:hypothetical protein
VDKIDGFELYSLGAALQPLLFLKGTTPSEKGTTWGDSNRVLSLAESRLDGFLKGNAFKMRVSTDAGNQLLITIRTVRSNIQDFSKRSNHLDVLSHGLIEQATTTFLNVVKAELPYIPLYFVGKKGGYDTDALIEHGEVFFPDDLATKVPEAIPDIQQGARCIAFDLATAAGYHLHRANEAVLRRYWDIVMGGVPRPRNATMGFLIAEMDRQGAGEPKVRASLRDIVQLHRNPLAHPEQSLENVNEAIALMNGIHSAIVHMLRAIP